MTRYVEKRFKLLGTAFIFRKRVHKSRGYTMESTGVFNALHMGRVSLYWQKLKPNRKVGNQW
jgi:hypothetical protein